jgi:hypothetical protein
VFYLHNYKETLNDWSVAILNDDLKKTLSSEENNKILLKRVKKLFLLAQKTLKIHSFHNETITTQDDAARCNSFTLKHCLSTGTVISAGTTTTAAAT